MALFRKFFNRKLPDGLLEISERVYVFDCCFSTDNWENNEYKIYIGGIVSQLRNHFPDASFMVFNFREGKYQSQIASRLSEYDMTVMDYPCQYEGCPLLTMEMIHHFLRSSEIWLSLGQQNVILMHCERGGWPVLAFMLAALLINRKQFTSEQKTLDMTYKHAPRELLRMMSPLNPLPSQLRYLQYVSRRNVDSKWPPPEKALSLDCITLRFFPNMDGEGGCRPIFRIYGQDPFMAADRTTKVLFSTPKKSKFVQYYKQVDCELVKIDIHCNVLGDVVLECISLGSDQERESMMFRVMFNTAFIKSNILMLNCEEIDILWNAKDQFPKDYRAEVIFSEINVGASVISTELLGMEEKHGLPMEAFSKVQDSFSNVDWLSPKTNVTNVLQENLETGLKGVERTSVLHHDKVKEIPKLLASEHIITSPTSAALDKQSTFSFKPSLGANSTTKKFEPQEIQVAPQKPSMTTSFLGPSSDLSSIEGKTELQELQVTAQEPEHSKTSVKPFPEANLMRRKVETQELHVALRQPVQSTTSVRPYCNSLQGSPVPISRYRSAPSALGITALLHDHAISQSEERIHPVTLPLSSSSILSPLSNTPKPLWLSLTNASPTPTSPGPQSTAEPSLTSKASPILSPEVIINATHTEHPGSTSPDRGQSSFIPPHPSSPSLSATSSAMENSNSTPSFSSQPHSLPEVSPPPEAKNSFQSPSLPPPPPSTVKNLFSAPPPPPPPSSMASSPTCSISSPPQLQTSGPPTPPPPPLRSGSVSGHTGKSLLPHAPPLPCLAPKGPPNNSTHVPPVPPPLTPCEKGLSKACGTAPQSDSVSNGNIPSIPGPPSGAPLNLKGWGISCAGPKNQAQPRKSNLKPYHWLKLTRAMQGSLWADAQKPEEASKAPDFDMSELESLFSAAAPNLDNSTRDGKSNHRASGCKSEKVQLIELRRAYNCEIMLTKVKIPLPELMCSVLTLDDTALDAYQVENLIKFCPTKEEMELLKGYNGDKEKLGKCEQFFLELMKVPRVESKLRVFLFKIQFCTHVSDLRNSLNIVNSASEEVRSSVKLKRIMQTVLSLGNALNHGTARGSAIGFRLDSLLKLTDTRSRNNKMTLMHYLCKVLVQKLGESTRFSERPWDFGSFNKDTIEIFGRGNASH